MADTRQQMYDDISHPMSQVPEIIEMCMGINKAVLMLGEPGVGKTSVWRSVANKLGYKSLVIAPCNHDSVDLKLPYISVKQVTVDGKECEQKVAAYAIGEILPREGKHMLLLDDLTNCPPDLQATFYSLVNEGCIGDYTIPEGSYVGAAGNRVIDKCNASELSAALKNRCIVINVRTDADGWIKNFAMNNNVHPAVIGFLKNKTDPFTDGFDATDPCGGFTARSAEALSKLLHKYEDALNRSKNPINIRHLIKGVIGRAKGEEFMEFYDLYKKNVCVVDILKGQPFDDTQLSYATLFSLVWDLSAKTDKTTITNYADFMDRQDDDIKALGLGVLRGRPGKLLFKDKRLENFSIQHAELFL